MITIAREDKSESDRADPCRGVWPYAPTCRALARSSPARLPSYGAAPPSAQFRAGMVQAHRRGEARRHSCRRFRRRAVAPVPAGGRRLQQKIRRESRSLHRQRHRHGQPRARRTQSRQDTSMDVALISSPREQPEAGAVGIAGAVRAAAHSSRGGRHVRIGTAVAIGTPTKHPQVHVYLPRDRKRISTRPGTTPTRSKKPRSRPSRNRPIFSTRAGKGRSPAKAWATLPGYGR